MKAQRPRRAPRGFLVLDVMMALAVLGAVAVILVSASSRTQRASDRLSNARHAGRVAEETLIDLEAGLPPPKPDSETRIAVEATEGGAQVPGHKWVQVIVEFRGEARLLVGLVPQGADIAPAGGGR